MKQLEIRMPRPAIGVGGNIDNYPNGWDWSFEQLIREFWRPNHPEVLANPTEIYEITFPGYGVLTMQNREFKLEFTKEYAAKKGYAETMEGTWG